MEVAGSNEGILIGTMLIDTGRKNLTINGLEKQGRIHFEEGIFTVTKIFTEVRASEEPCEAIVVVERLFLQQELQFCHKLDTFAINSLTNAIQSFDDAMRTLKVVHSSSLYQAVEASYPTSNKYRVKGLPKDAFHIACGAHRARIHNTLRTPGMNPDEKALYKLRADNMLVAQGLYMDKQRLAIEAITG